MSTLLTPRALVSLAVVLALGALIPAAAVAIRRRNPAQRGTSVAFLTLRIAAFVAAALMIFQRVWAAPVNLNDDHRLAPSAALLHGYPPYYPPETGPALSTIYGPVTVWTYVPAALFHTPSNAVRAGVVINMLMYYLPLLFLCWAIGRGTERQYWAECALILYALTTFNLTLDTASGILHADAPALGWAAVACGLTLLSLQTGRIGYIAAAGLASALSVLAKQVMVPALPAIALYLLLVSGWRSFWAYTVSAAAFLFGLLEVAALSMGGWQAMLYNIVYIPTHQPYRREQLTLAIDMLARQSAALAMLAGAGLALHYALSKQRKMGEWLARNPSALLVAVALALSTTSILGKIKVVGSVNTLCPTVYFLLAAGMAELQRVGALAWNSEKKSALRNAAAAAILAVFVVVQLPMAIYSLMVPKPQDYMATVYTFSKRHPGEVYFPEFPLSVLMGSGQLFHFAWGLSDRAEAGRPVSAAYFHRYVPGHAKVAAMVPWVWNDEIYRYLGNEVQRPDLAELPGFKFYEIRESPSAPGEPTAIPPGDKLGDGE